MISGDKGWREEARHPHPHPLGVCDLRPSSSSE